MSHNKALYLYSIQGAFQTQNIFGLNIKVSWKSYCLQNLVSTFCKELQYQVLVLYHRHISSFHRPSHGFNIGKFLKLPTLGSHLRHTYYLLANVEKRFPSHLYTRLSKKFCHICWPLYLPKCLCCMHHSSQNGSVACLNLSVCNWFCCISLPKLNLDAHAHWSWTQQSPHKAEADPQRSRQCLSVCLSVCLSHQQPSSHP